MGPESLQGITEHVIVFHVTTAKKLGKYLACGHIKAPVRAWKSMEAAVRFSNQTGRRIILRLKVPAGSETLEGHRGEAVILDKSYPIVGF